MPESVSKPQTGKSVKLTTSGLEKQQKQKQSSKPKQQQQHQQRPKQNKQAIRRIAHLQSVARLLAGQGGQAGQMLARQHAESLFTLAEKSQTRLPPQLRRGFCRRCRLPLVSGVTADIRCKRQRRHRRLVATVACRLCQGFASYGFGRNDWIQALLPGPVNKTSQVEGAVTD